MGSLVSYRAGCGLSSGERTRDTDFLALPAVTGAAASLPESSRLLSAGVLRSAFSPGRRASLAPPSLWLVTVPIVGRGRMLSGFSALSLCFRSASVTQPGVLSPSYRSLPDLH